MKVLITGVGGPTPRSFAIAAKKYGSIKSLTFVGTDVNPLSIGLYKRELFKNCYLVPRAGHPEYWSTIEKIIVTEKIDAAIILPEAEVLEWSKRMSTGLPCKALIPDCKLVSLLLDKSLMTSELNSLGVVPKSIEFARDMDNYSKLLNGLDFPFWVRSSVGSSGLGSLKVNDMHSLEQWISINPSVDKFLASEYLPGRNLACKLLYWKGSLVRAACAERVNYIMSKVAPSGITGNTSFGRLLNEPEVIRKANLAMDFLFDKFKIDKHGFFTIDLKEDSKGKPLITEINVRHVAFTQCFAAGGANFADDTIRLLMGEEFDMACKFYQFEGNLIFLRDVDEQPIVMQESDLLSADFGN